MLSCVSRKSEGLREEERGPNKGGNDIWWRKSTRCESANGSLIKCEMICRQHFRVTTAERLWRVVASSV
jgi:hypothetical protein